MLEIRILLFIELAKSGSLEEAASKMNLELDQAKAMILSLEQELKCKLFSQYRTSYRLTRLGEKFYHGCTRLQEMADDLIEEMDFIPVPRIAIGFTGTRDNQKVIELASLFKQKYPSANFTYHKGTPQLNLERLFEQKVDICFGLQSFFDDRAGDLWIETLFHYNICFIFPKDHPLAKEKVIQPNRLESENLLVLGRQYAQNFYYDPLIACNIRTRGLFTTYKRTLDDLLKAVREKQGIGIASQEVIDPAHLEELGLAFAIYPNNYCAAIRAGESRQEILDFIDTAKIFFGDFDLETAESVQGVSSIEAPIKEAEVSDQTETPIQEKAEPRAAVKTESEIPEAERTDKMIKKELKKAKKEQKAQIKLEKYQTGLSKE